MRVNLHVNHTRLEVAGCCFTKMRKSNHAAMPPSVAFMKSPSHLAWGWWIGKEFDPFIANAGSRLPVYTDVGVGTGRVRGLRETQC